MVSPADRLRIAVQGIVSEMTVRRAYLGRVSPYSRRRVVAAAQALGLPLPPEPSMESSTSSQSELPRSSSTNLGR